MRGFGGFAGLDGFHWLGPIFLLLLLAAVVVGVVLLVQALSSRNSPSAALAGGAGAVAAGKPAQAPARAASGPTGALTILEERFARGDIDREEFLQRRNDLLSQPGAAAE